MNSLIKRSIIVIAVASVPFKSVAEDLCADLNRAASLAGNRYISVRGEIDFETGTYPVDLTIGEYQSCKATVADTLVYLRCSKVFGFDRAAAEDSFDTSVDTLKGCYDNEFHSVDKRDPDFLIYHGQTNFPEDDQITLILSGKRKKSGSSMYVLKFELVSSTGQ
jgi:hypothetical protein